MSKRKVIIVNRYSLEFDLTTFELTTLLREENIFLMMNTFKPTMISKGTYIRIIIDMKLEVSEMFAGVLQETVVVVWLVPLTIVVLVT